MQERVFTTERGDEPLSQLNRWLMTGNRWFWHTTRSLRFSPGSRRRFPRSGASGRTTRRRVRARRGGMRGCAAVSDGSGSTECPMATRRRSLRWICSCRCVNCSYDECVGSDQTIAVQGFVSDQPLLSNNRSPYGVSPALLHKRGHLIISYPGLRDRLVGF